MKLSDVKIGEIFTIRNTPSYPKMRTSNGYVDMNDNIVKSVEDLPWDLRLLTTEELKESLRYFEACLEHTGYNNYSVEKTMWEIRIKKLNDVISEKSE